VLVTGASSGIGAAIAREAAAKGHRLALTARRADRLAQLSDELGREGAEVAWFSADLADPSEPERLVAEVVERFGTLDVLINNAGVGLPHLYSAAEPAAIRRQLEVNLMAPLILTRAALPWLVERKGVVINVGSAITAFASPALGVYGTTKAGLAYWNDALRREVKHKGVRVCLVEPGPVVTEFFEAIGASPPGRLAEYDALTQPPPGWLSGDAAIVARRIVRLVEHPRRRLTVVRRGVWPYRGVGLLFRFAPWFGDVCISRIVSHFNRPGAEKAPASVNGRPLDAPAPR
jgi:short-subunit dehydrogenase